MVVLTVKLRLSCSQLVGELCDASVCGGIWSASWDPPLDCLCNGFCGFLGGCRSVQGLLELLPTVCLRCSIKVHSTAFELLVQLCHEDAAGDIRCWDDV